MKTKDCIKFECPYLGEQINLAGKKVRMCMHGKPRIPGNINCHLDVF